MRLIGKRPLCRICTLLLLSAFSAVLLRRGAFFLFLGAAIFAAGVLVILLCCGRIRFYPFCMAICLCAALPIGFGTASRYYTAVDQIEARAGETVLVEGRLTEKEWSSSGSAGYILRADRIDGKSASTSFLLSCRYSAGMPIGTQVRVRAELGVHEQGAGGFDEKRYYLSRGVPGVLIADMPDAVEILSEDAFSLTIFFERINLFLSARLRVLLGERSGRLLSALFLGRRGDLEGTVVRDFRRLGISHILALSGMHLSILIAAAENFLLSCRVKRNGRRILQLSFVFLYVLLTGAPISIVRSAVMVVLGSLASICFDESDGITALFSAVTLICLFNPPALIDIALWMSFLATLVILLFAKFKFERFPHLIRGVLKNAAASLAITLLLLPLSALFGGEYSHLAIPANLIFVPLTTVLLYAAPIVLLTGKLFAFPIECLSDLVLWLANRLSALRNITVPLASPGIWPFLLPALCILPLFLLKPPKQRRGRAIAAFAAAMLFFLVGPVYPLLRRDTEIVYTASDQNEAIVLRSGGILICDFGDGNYGAICNALACAEKLGAGEVETIMLTHYHNKHVTSLRSVLMRATVRSIYIPEPQNEYEREIALALTALAGHTEIDLRIYHYGESIIFGNSALRLYRGQSSQNKSHPTLVCTITHEGDVLTYLGASALESNDAPHARNLASESRYLILGTHGVAPARKIILGNSRAEGIVSSDPKTIRIFETSADVLPVCAETYTFHFPSQEGKGKK